jgi:SAM-dependent methyltransferase
MDAVASYKEGQRQVWAGFAVVEANTAMAAPALLRFAGVDADSTALDVACGTGVVALTAARMGAKVTGVDLTPELIDRARTNSDLIGVTADWHVGDAESLPFEDGQFDVVVSQFGHMFAPRPDVAVSEMLRVLRPGGTIAFSTWPPDLLVGRTFALGAKYGPPLPEGIPPPIQWGDPDVIRARLAEGVTDLSFETSAIFVPMLSPEHARLWVETNLGPTIRLLEYLEGDPERLAAYRQEHLELIEQFFEDNRLRQDFLMTRAIKE